MNETHDTTWAGVSPHQRDTVAAILSIVPGLGHIYKGHYRVGFTLMLLGIPLSLWMGLLTSLATLGLGLLIPVAFWVLTAANAFMEPDWRRHHLI
jgi:hypothetical protein